MRRYRFVFAIFIGFIAGASGAALLARPLSERSVNPTSATSPASVKKDKKIGQSGAQDKTASGGKPEAKEYAAEFRKVTQASEPKPLEIVDAGFTIGDAGGHVVYYAIIIKNPNNDYLAESPQITIKMKDDSGKALGTKQQIVGRIMPLQTLAWAGKANPEEGVPTTAKFSLSAGSWQKSSPTPLDEFKVTDFTIVRNALATTATGEVFNPQSVKQNITLTVIFKDSKGNVVTGFNGFVKDIPSRSSRAFELIPSGLPNVDYSEAFASVQPW